MISAIAREVTTMRTLMRTLGRIKPLHPDGEVTVPDVIEAWVEKRPDNVALLFEDERYTYREFDAAANRYAHWARGAGIGHGDVVALLMENRPDYLFAWFGLVKIGATAALINTNQTGQALAHSLELAGARHLILGAELAEHYASAVDLMGERPKVWAQGARVQGAEDLDAALEAAPREPLGRAAREAARTGDKCFYIYTSGTTGLPKAAVLTHVRVLTMMHAFASALNATEKDRIYIVLPLYHSAGGICAVGTVLTVGGSIVLRRKFSVHRFWDDAVSYEATLFQYIGELCRYLLNAPAHPLERKHKLRAISGNGLRPEIWGAFKERFKIPRIYEFYGSTEGNVSLFNFDGRIGAVGRIPPYLSKSLPVKIVRFDLDCEAPVRGPDGFCIECPPGEPGEVIGQITDDPKTQFKGYTKASDTSKKILENVFAAGDKWFRTGDLMKRDKDGYFYFLDRIGDTFRWKGENVATSEVAEVLSVFPGVKEANVYGVRVPEADGRAGMAAIVTEEPLDFEKLKSHMARNLPDYARPIFIRLQREMEVTGTFKHRKVELVKEGFRPGEVTDPLYFFHPKEDRYVPLSERLYEEISAGAIKL